MGSDSPWPRTPVTEPAVLTLLCEAAVIGSLHFVTFQVAES